MLRFDMLPSQTRLNIVYRYGLYAGLYPLSSQVITFGHRHPRNPKFSVADVARSVQTIGYAEPAPPARMIP